VGSFYFFLRTKSTSKTFLHLFLYVEKCSIGEDEFVDCCCVWVRERGGGFFKIFWVLMKLEEYVNEDDEN
jgi:hypothetical protein